MAILVQSNKKPSVSYPEQTGSIVTFNSQYAGLPLKSCKVDIPVTQEGTGDPSPDNVRNFVGVDSLDFSATGKNLFSYDLAIRDGYWANGFFGTNVIVPKENAGGWQYIRVYVEGLSSVTLSGFDTTDGTNCAWLSSENPNDIISEFNSSNKNGTKTVPSGAKFLCLVIFSIKNNSTTYPNAQLEIGNTATDYQPFGNNKLFTFEQTVYAGELNVLTGIFTATHGVVDLGSLNWIYVGDGLFRTPIISNMKTEYSPNWRCEIYSVTTATDYSGWGNKPNNTIGFLSTYSHIITKDDRYTDGNDLKTALNGMKLVYELVIPEVINLGGMEISALQGENNLFASTGDTTVSFIKIGG